MVRRNGRIHWEFVEIPFHTWKNTTREAIQNQDLQLIRRCLDGTWHREGMTEYTVHYSAQAHGIICSIWTGYRIIVSPLIIFKYS